MEEKRAAQNYKPMQVCDEKITKLKKRIKSELPVYSQEQINRSREVTLECALDLGEMAARLSGARNAFNSPLRDEVLRKAFKDQAEMAILKSRQFSNVRTASARVQMAHTTEDKPRVQTRVESPRRGEGTSRKSCAGNAMGDAEPGKREKARGKGSGEKTGETRGTRLGAEEALGKLGEVRTAGSAFKCIKNHVKFKLKKCIEDLPLMAEKGRQKAYSKANAQQEMQRPGGPRKGEPGTQAKEAIGRDESRQLSSILKESSQPSGLGKCDEDARKKNAMDLLFKQFPLRNSFTEEESRAKGWKRESGLGKRSAEESKGEAGLITDLKALRRHEQRERRREDSRPRKRFISEYFGEENAPKGPPLKRCQFWSR